MRDSAPEQRTVDVDVENVRQDGNTLRGHAAVFNVLSEDLGGYRERIAPGAFAGVLADSDVRLLVDHKPPPLARTKSGTLKLSEDETGLAFEAELPDTTYARDLKESLRRGDWDGMSFRFAVGDEDWSTQDGAEVRTVKTVSALEDICVATYPAYPAASVELRTRPDRDTENDNEGELPPAARREERTMNENETETEQRAGGLAVEDRAAATDDKPSPEEQFRQAVRDVRRGESRALTTAAGVSSAEVSTMLFNKLTAGAVALASGIKILRTESDSITYPQETAGVSPDWYAEAATITAGDPTLTTTTVTPRKLAHRVEMSNELIDDSDPSAIDVVRNILLRDLAVKLDDGVYEGSGTPPEITGLKNVSSIQTVTAVGTPANLDFVADALALLHTENVPGPYVAVMHPRTWTTLAKLVEGTGSNKPLLADSAGSPTEGLRTALFGVPVFLTSQVSIAEGVGTDESSVYIYAPSEVYLVWREGPTIEVDRSRLFDTDQSEMRGKIRVGGVLAPNPKAVVRASGITAA